MQLEILLFSNSIKSGFPVGISSLEISLLFKLDNHNISNLEIPTGNPLVLEFNDNQVMNSEYLDKERAKDLLVF